MQVLNLCFMQALEIRFGKAVRRLRESRGISQEDFASRAEIHRTYISSVERGKVVVSIGVAERIASALEMPLSRLFKETENEG
ncbi:MAG: helix-turn-helix transcriptional regulator [Planctomycetota bacterium]